MRALFCTQLAVDSINDIWLALQQSQALGSSRVTDLIEQITWQRSEVKARGQPRKIA